MKKKFKTLKIVALSLVLGLVINLAMPAFVHDSTQAVGGLDVVWGVPDGDPIFVVENMLPGDQELRSVTVNNGASVARLISVKGTRTGGIGLDPKLETVLEIIISESGVDLYGGTTGAKTVQGFFDDSQDPG